MTRFPSSQIIIELDGSIQQADALFIRKGRK